MFTIVPVYTYNGGFTWSKVCSSLKRECSRKIKGGTGLWQKQNNSDIKTYTHRLFFDKFLYSWYFIIFCIYSIYNALETTIFSARRLCQLESLRASKAETPGGQTNWRLSALYIKQIPNRLLSTIDGNVVFVHTQYSCILTSHVSTRFCVRQNYW